MSRRYKDWLEREARESPVYLPTTTRDADGYPLYGVDVAGPPPPREGYPRFERGVDPGVKKALVLDGLERRLDASLNTQVPRPVTEYEKQLIEEIRRLKEDAAPPPRYDGGLDPNLKKALKTDVPVPDRPLSEQERLRVEEVRQLKKGMVIDGRKVGWHNF